MDLYDAKRNAPPSFCLLTKSFLVKGCTHKNDMPPEAQEWFTRPAREGYEWKCLNGKWPEEVPIPPESAEQQKTTCCQAIDTTAGLARKRFISNSELIEIEYEHTYRDAIAYIASNYKPPCPASVKSHAQAFKTTQKEAANAIKTTGDGWYKTIDLIRDIRLKGKKAIENAPDDSDFNAIAKPFIKKLNAIEPDVTV